MKLVKSSNKNKKWAIIAPDGKTIHFGDSRYEDYTIHKDKKRKSNYEKRHKNENWRISGIKTAGFWSKWLLWNKPTLKESIKDIHERFNIKITSGVL